MSKKKWIITICSILLVALLSVGYMAIAAEYGSKEDPLVTLSYITDVLSPDTLSKVDQAVAQKADALEAQLTEKMKDFSTEIDAKISAFQKDYATQVTSDALVEKVASLVLEKMGVSETAPVTASEWKVVTLKKGQKITGDVGVELLLRIGSASCYATGSPGLINLTSGTVLSSGQALSQNNLYIVTVSGRGLTATNDATLLIKGNYVPE